MSEAVLENQYADELRQTKAGGSPLSKGGIGGLNSSENETGGTSFRERIMAARQAMDLKERAKKKIEEKVMAPVKAGTNWLLKASWLNLIDSFGLTLIYINTHLFLRQIFPDAFCKLGEEWKPKMVGESSASNIAGTAFGIVEVMGLLLLDLIVIFIILGVLAIISMIITWATNPAEALKAIWDLGWTGIEALVSLFKGLLSYLFKP
jgi:hypothetical protein